ncbi:hypothetical protein [Streptomyces sp. DH12]|uniref:hypothetical protein n=1 Tax=Streptomyces sp. DH12 TaxID=2857010 RepID=UPI001E4F3114|nr:hypothetical protein [Streptomyces sp. DH12]
MTRPYARHIAAAAAATALLALAAPAATAAPLPADPAPGPREAAAAPATLDTLARFFGREGAAAAKSADAARPRIEGSAVPVHVLSPEFVAGRAGAPVARVEFHAARAVAADGREASVWSVRQGAGWRVVNIATGDDEIHFAERGARVLPGGTVFREPQIDAWYVHGGGRVLPLDEDAVRAVGAGGTTLAAYRARVAAAYGDKLPGSAYARAGKAGGYDPTGPTGPAARTDAAGPAVRTDATGPAAGAGATGPAEAAAGLPATATAAAAAGAALLAAALVAVRPRRRRER